MAEVASSERKSSRRRGKRASAEDVAREYFDALAARDPDAMAALWHADGVEDIVPLGVFRGPDDVRAVFRELFAAVPDFEFTVRRVIADDGVAVVEWRATGTFDGRPFQGIEPTGRRVELRGSDWVEVEDGQIVRNTGYYDGAAFARGIGMLPPQDSGGERAMIAAFNLLTRLRRRLKEIGR
jgi:steroid delta-isomerase-like uncharacterized protein